MSTIKVKIKDEERAYFFVTKYDIPKDSFVDVVVEDLPRASAERFLAGILLGVLDGNTKQDAIDKLSAYVYGTADSGPPDATLAGHVSITDVTPSDDKTVGSKVFSQDGNRLEAAITSTKQITAHIRAMTGPSNYKPNIMLGGRNVIITEEPTNRGVWTGSVDVLLPNDGVLLATHEDGATDTTNILFLTPPRIISAEFVNGYPGSQTELKEDDVYDVLVVSESPMSGISVQNQGASKAETFSFAETTSKIITVRIADRGDVSALLPVILRASNSSGALGDFYDSSTGGNQDGVNVVRCNNTHPSIALGGIDYPVGQEALKDLESADVAVTYSNADQILFSSPNGQLNIPESMKIEPIKEVQRASGDYNISSNNLKAVAVKVSNMAKASAEKVIAIVNSAPVLTVSNLPRLRSGGANGTAAQNHTVVLNSNQKLMSTPTMIAQPGKGILLGSWVGSSTSFVRQMRVADTDPRGIFIFMGVGATGLSGLTTSTLASGLEYEIGGFVKRRIYFSALSKEKALGTNVVNTAKLSASDKDEIPMVYQNSLDNGSRTYTITGPSETANPEGDLLRWTDDIEINNNTTGNSFIEIEELP